MKLAFIGASHWHLPLYLDPALEVPGVEIVGISDPDLQVAETLAGRLGCSASTDFRALCDKLRPDFVFALGRHCDMPNEASWLIEAGIPFALEKPCGTRSADVERIAAEARAKGAFAAVPLVFRNGELLQLLRELDDGSGYQTMSYRFIAGFPTRYHQAGCDWMLDPRLSGGGCTINLSVHFFDLCRLLMGDAVTVSSAAMSNAAWQFPVEDHSCVTLESVHGLCVAETGYLYPAPTSNFDMHYSIRSSSRYIVVHDWNDVEIIELDGKSQRRRISSTNVPHYRDFVFDVLDRAAHAKPPLAGLDDMIPTLRLVEDAYEIVRNTTGRDFNGHGRNIHDHVSPQR